ncbi:MAG: hypothetical protein ACAH80_11435 [Alphaproteobacteria bacterium]
MNAKDQQQRIAALSDTLAVIGAAMDERNKAAAAFNSQAEAFRGTVEDIFARRAEEETIAQASLREMTLSEPVSVRSRPIAYKGRQGFYSFY